jgi:hypothetical protein
MPLPQMDPSWLSAATALMTTHLLTFFIPIPLFMGFVFYEDFFDALLQNLHKKFHHPHEKGKGEEKLQQTDHQECEGRIQP